MYDSRVVMLNLNTLRERLTRVKKQDYYPLVLTTQYRTSYGVEMETLPTVIRERDTEYQFHRVLLFSKLLKGYPYTRDRIIAESQKDIPPLLRGEIWACLLNVMEDNSYEAIDKFTPTPTDRQIDVDIPRCHQYDELLSSPEGHGKLKRLLKAWVQAHPQYVYWQGLDSLTAPFLYLNFNNEGMRNNQSQLTTKSVSFNIRNAFHSFFPLVYRTGLSESLQIHTEIFAMVLFKRQFIDHQRIFEQILAVDRIPRANSCESSERDLLYSRAVCHSVVFNNVFT